VLVIQTVGLVAEMVLHNPAASVASDRARAHFKCPQNLALGVQRVPIDLTVKGFPVSRHRMMLHRERLT